jgi:tRNA modification GTPase
VEFADRTALVQLLQKIESKLKSLIDSFQYGNAIKSGVAVAIIGKPNAGKSTLLNALLKEERAIVSDIAGTTRDTIEEVLHIKGNAFRLIDTAGLRETEDAIEAIGVVKAKEKVAQADVLVYLIDVATTDLKDDLAMLQELAREDLKIIICLTKIDEVEQAEEKAQTLKIFNLKFLHELLQISAKENIHLQDLKDELSTYVEHLKSESNVVITNQSHYEALQKSIDAVYKVKEAITHQISTELLAYELRNALEHLGKSLGNLPMMKYWGIFSVSFVSGNKYAFLLVSFSFFYLIYSIYVNFIFFY